MAKTITRPATSKYWKDWKPYVSVRPCISETYTAAGSTITQDVPAQALGIARERQTNLEGWAEPKMEAYIAKKQKLEADQNK